jgi:hypothetical protein
MKKITNWGSITFYFLSIERTGYVIVTENFEIYFGHSIGGGITGNDNIASRINAFCQVERPNHDRIIMCSHEGLEMCKEFGVDVSFHYTEMNASEREATQSQVENLCRTELAKAKVANEEKLANEKKDEELQRRKSEVTTLVRAFRYGDAKEHCRIHGLDYDDFIK